MEPDYLPIPEIFVSAMIVPQLDFTIRLCIPGIWGVWGPLLTPGWGCGGQRAPEAKNQVVFAHGFSAHCIIVPILELLVLGVGKHYIFVSWLCILYRVVL